MKKWDTGIFIDDYLIQVQLKEKGGVYYANADSFFLVAAIGDTEEECLERLKALFMRIREYIFQTFLRELEINKAPLE